MTVTMTPPPMPPTGGPAAGSTGSAGTPGMPGTTPTRGSSRLVATLAIVFGAVLILGTLAWGAVSTILGATVRGDVRAVGVNGVTSLDVDLGAGDLRIEYDDVNEASLAVRSTFGADRWTLRVDEDELTVASPQWIFGLGWIIGGNGEAVLTLPRALEGLDADLDLGAGEITAIGEFGELDIDLGAGQILVEGSARELSAEISAGSADLELADVRTAQLSVSAGSMRASLSGSMPNDITAQVSAGSLDLAVPEGQYDVSSDVSAGSFDNRIGSQPGADDRIRVDVSAGEATLTFAH